VTMKDRIYPMTTKNEIYYSDSDIIIRDFRESDAKPLTDAELLQGWHTDISKFISRLSDRDSGKCISLAAEYKGNIAGYVNVYFDPPGTPFSGKGYCEIVDFAVLEKFRRKGIGGKLMDIAEKIGFKSSDTIFLGVGFHSGYGSAQRMYFKRGYIPDGCGAWYKNSPTIPYESYDLDDDLILYLSKKAP
jgi:ribosomal protein S18 acetylase RimI-like enzyme